MAFALGAINGDEKSALKIGLGKHEKTMTTLMSLKNFPSKTMTVKCNRLVAQE